MNIAKDFLIKLVNWFFDFKEFDYKEQLFQEHSEQFLSSWVRRLKYFRFLKAHGGHGSPPDKILLSLRYDGQDDLTALLQSLNIKYRRFTEKPPQPIPNHKYYREESKQFPDLIIGTEWIEQPKHQVLNNVDVSIWCYPTRMTVTISGRLENKWRITQTEFENAAKIEFLFDKHIQRMIDPPEDTQYCLCPKYYPEYWEPG